jgi:hypothetical protein
MAAAILANLACDGATRQSILDEGGLQPLIVACRSSDGDIVSNATKALRNLKLDKDSIPLAVKLGIVPTLRELCFTSNDSTVIKNCISVIGDLSEEDTAATMLVQEGMLRVLSNLVGTQKDKAVLHSLVQAMHKLCIDRNSRMLLAAQDTIEALVRLGKTTAEAIEAARLTALFVSLSTESENLKMLAELGVEEAVVYMHDRCDENTLTESSATVILNLADCEDCEHEKFNGPAVGVVAKALLHSDKLQSQSLHYLASAPGTADSTILGLAAPSAGQEDTKPVDSKVVSEVISKVASILGQFKQVDDAVLVDAADLLKRFSLIDEGRSACVNCGVVVSITALLTDSSGRVSNTARQATTATLTNLSCADGSMVQFIEHDAIQCLLTLTGDSDPKIRYNVTATLANLLRSKGVREQFVDSDGLEVFSKLLASTIDRDDDRTLTNVLHAYRVLTKHPDGTSSVARDGTILEPLLAVISKTGEDSTRIVQSGVEILARLAADQHFRALFIEADDGVETLANVVQAGHKDGSSGILKFATGVLARLAQDNLAKPKLISHNLVPTLVDMCGTKGDSTVIGYSALVLARLSTPSGELFEDKKPMVLSALQSVQKRFGKNVPTYLQGPLITAISVLK